MNIKLFESKRVDGGKRTSDLILKLTPESSMLIVYMYMPRYRDQCFVSYWECGFWIFKLNFSRTARNVINTGVLGSRLLSVKEIHVESMRVLCSLVNNDSHFWLSVTCRPTCYQHTTVSRPTVLSKPKIYRKQSFRAVPCRILRLGFLTSYAWSILRCTKVPAGGNSVAGWTHKL